MANNLRYFIYSAAQLKERQKIEKSIGREFIPGTVAVGAKKMRFTEINSTGYSRYSDATIVASGDIRKIMYTDIRSV